MIRPHVVVVGGGLAGIQAALDCIDGGARVTLVERRRRLGGLTWSFEHEGHWVDNGQHVFLRCCEAYLGFLDRVGSAGDVFLQDRLDVAVVAPGRLRRPPAEPGRLRRPPAEPGDPPRSGRIRRSSLPAPAHLAASLAAYRLLSVGDRARIGLAALPLRRLDLSDPALDDQTFGDWLTAHGQRPAAIAALWDLITVATVNLPAAEASLAMGAKVFQTGLLTHAAAADIGWSTIPLGRLHGERAASALSRGGADVILGEQVVAISNHRPAPGSVAQAPFEVRTGRRTLSADAVIAALPHDAVAAVLPPGAIDRQDQLAELGHSPIVDVHLTFDRTLTDHDLLAGVGTPLQWLFDRSVSSGLVPSRPAAPNGGGPDRQKRPPRPTEPGRPQYLAISLSAADEAQTRRPDTLVGEVIDELPRLLPEAAHARVTSSLVTKERMATFRAVPGTAALRLPARTRVRGLWLAGAWTDTGWPATMEGACRSGRTAARGALTDTDGATHDAGSDAANVVGRRARDLRAPEEVA